MQYIIPNTSLKIFNTFGLEIKAQNIFIAKNIEVIVLTWLLSKQTNQSFIVLGQGSNVIFLEDFHGYVVINAIKGIILNESNEEWHLHIGAGENWNDLVKLTLTKGITGLENLAFIPGMVGAAPIQNIGAYGVEFKNFCHYVEVLHLPTQKIFRLYKEECKFGYRDSIFKHTMKDDYVIIAVGICLKKKWEPKLNYGDLTKVNSKGVDAKDIFNIIYNIRQNKLPDPKFIGNVGSFFKNPLIDIERATVLLTQCPIMPYYPQDNGEVKLAAGWLIDQCNLKGYRIGGASVYTRQALILINENHAKPQDVVMLAQKIRNQVGEKFHVWLEPEVRFIGASGECNPIEIIS